MHLSALGNLLWKLRVKHMIKDDVLMLCQFFYPEHISSATLPFDTACALARAGLKVGALCGYPKEYTDRKTCPYQKQRKGLT